jgi:putative methionine-R-sulfoxide reductase with GAF domain
MSLEGMDPNPEILEQENAAPADGPEAEMPGAREWPGLTAESSAPRVKFPGEDGGRSLAKMAECDLDAALQLLAERAQYITGATGAAIALRDGDEMVCRATAGGSAPEIGARLQMDSGLSGESIRTRTMLRCDDAQTDGRVNRESCEALGIASVVVMPMVDGGEVIGVFELFSDRAYAFEDRDIVALDRMSAMVRTAMDEAAGLRESKGDEPHEVAPAVFPASPSLIAVEPGIVEMAPELIEAPATLIGGAPDFVESSPGFGEMSTEVASVAESESKAAAFHEEMHGEAATATPDEERVLEEENEQPVALAATTPELASNDEGEPLFLAEPENPRKEDAPAIEPAARTPKPDEVVEADMGEIARDAAERTAAWKASLFAGEAPPASSSAAPAAGEKRIAFHMRIPKRIDTPIAEPPVVAANAEAPVVGLASSESGKRETPATEGVPEGDAIAGVPVDGGEPPARAAREGQSIGEQDASFANASPKISVSTGFAAAAAPAKESGMARPAVLPRADVLVAAAPPSPAPTSAKTTSAKTDEAPKVKPGIARPASAEGRARIAVSQVRKCEACGFPVSEGRKLCLDCEKKGVTAPKATASPAETQGTSAANAVARVAPDTPEAVASNEKTEAAVPPVATVAPQVSSSAVESKIDSVEVKNKTVDLMTASNTSEIGDEKIPIHREVAQSASPKSESAPPAQDPTAEPPTLHFSAVTPEHSESWIQSHIYAAVAIALVVVGIVIYLLSR